MTVLFEHPLNKKMRTWLRIECLLKQLSANRSIVDYLSALIFFRNTNELLDVFESGELRTEILKELERQQQKLTSWFDVPGVNKNTIQILHNNLKICAERLIIAPRMGQLLREERLIGLVRQRLNISGGCCSFDLPTLHVWLHLKQEQRDEQVAVWLDSLSPIRNTLAILLDLIRQSGIFRHYTSINGLFHDNTEDAYLLRLQLKLEHALYPQISGHKNRFAIRFIALNSKSEVPSRLDFKLAHC